eukprot:m.209051 g.209051  ORF g.209051 m.209051 type:complete len:1054 (+) comp13771_c0_seq7:122-3283(+)
MQELADENRRLIVQLKEVQTKMEYVKTDQAKVGRVLLETKEELKTRGNVPEPLTPNTALIKEFNRLMTAQNSQAVDRMVSQGINLQDLTLFLSHTNGEQGNGDAFHNNTQESNKEMTILEEEAALMYTDLVQLRETLAHVASTMQTTENENSQLRTLVAELEAVKARQEHTITMMDAEVSIKERQYSLLQTRYNSFLDDVGNEDSQAAKHQITALEENITQLQNTTTDQNAEILSLRQRVGEMDVAMSALVSERDTATRQLHIALQECNGYKEHVEKVESEFKSVCLEVDELRTTCVDLSQQQMKLQQYKTAILTLKEKLELKAQDPHEIAEVVQKLSFAQANAKSAKREDTGTIAKRRESCDSFSNTEAFDLHHLPEGTDRRRISIATSNESMKSLEYIGLLQKQVELAKRQVEDKQTEVLLLTAENADLKEEMEVLQGKKHKKQQQYHSSQSDTHSEMINVDDEHNNNNGRVEQLQQEVELLEHDKEEKQRLFEQTISQRDNIILAMEESSIQIKRDLDDSKQECVNLGLKIEALKSGKARLSSLYEECMERLNELETNSAQQHHHASPATEEDASAKLAAQRQVVVLKEQVEELTARLDTLDSDKGLMEMRMRVAERALGESETELRRSQDDHERDIEELTREIRDQTNKVRLEMGQQLREKEEKVMQLEEKLAELEGNLSFKESRIDQLEAEIQNESMMNTSQFRDDRRDSFSLTPWHSLRFAINATLEEIDSLDKLPTSATEFVAAMERLQALMRSLSLKSNTPMSFGSSSATISSSTPKRDRRRSSSALNDSIQHVNNTSTEEDDNNKNSSSRGYGNDEDTNIMGEEKEAEEEEAEEEFTGVLAALADVAKLFRTSSFAQTVFQLPHLHAAPPPSPPQRLLDDTQSSTPHINGTSTPSIASSTNGSDGVKDKKREELVRKVHQLTLQLQESSMYWTNKVRSLSTVFEDNKQITTDAFLTGSRRTKRVVEALFNAFVVAVQQIHNIRFNSKRGRLTTSTLSSELGKCIAAIKTALEESAQNRTTSSTHNNSLAIQQQQQEEREKTALS